VGAWPLEAVACMDRIAREAEAHFRAVDHPLEYKSEGGCSIDDPITRTVVELAAKIGADAIVTPTVSGRTPRLIARHRPTMPIIAPVPNESILRQLSLVWGVRAVLREDSKKPGVDRMDAALKASFDSGHIRVGDRVILLSGHPVAGGLHLPTIRFVKVGDSGQPTAP